MRVCINIESKFIYLDCVHTLIIKSRQGSINLLYAPIWSGSIWSPRDRIRAIIGRSSEALINSADNIISVTIYRRPFPRRVFQIANKLFVGRYTRNGPLHFPLAKRFPDPFRRHYTELGRGWESLLPLSRLGLDSISEQISARLFHPGERTEKP